MREIKHEESCQPRDMIYVHMCERCSGKVNADEEVDELKSALAAEKERADKAESEVRLKTYELSAKGAALGEVSRLRIDFEKRAEAAEGRLDATLIAALRYESLHDNDPKRSQLWGELKMALMVERMKALEGRP